MYGDDGAGSSKSAAASRARQIGAKGRNASRSLITRLTRARISGSRGSARMERHPSARKLLGIGDDILRRIEDGRLKGDAACRKAAVALRKFNTAGEHAKSTASAAP